MTTGTWRFSALEFALLWQLAGREELPYPLQFRPDVSTRDDYTRQRLAAAAAIRPQLDRMLHRALFALASPEVSVEVCGFAGVDQDRKIRMHAGIQRDIGAVAVQEPGRDHDRGGDVLLSLCGSRTMASRIVESLPPVSAGNRRGLSIHTRDLEPSTAVLRSTRGRSASDDLDAFLDSRRTCIGHIAVRTAETTRDFHWMDFDNDGRYLTRGGEMLTAKPVSASDMTTELQRLISRGPICPTW
ncbi:ESX secretion-associated protein EspG [Antrihabitans cavernicola]|uniref:ESX secretion-associated protein EspG n=1 Tax=Antrihabitans cavernicola TaxID=2495913 RepID=UPI00165927CD|nr:ESX secretion-associated protein EspG [Spelaeibacter cavernicola]